MADLAKALPHDVAWSVPFDTTRFVNASIHEVYTTLFEAGALVLVVILIFLQDWRAMLVPATTVPVTIIGAFACMAALGFSVNLSTLFAIVLAIGIVVDDAIVVVEAAASYVEQGLSPHDAAVKAMDQPLGPIIGITLVLMSVFVPAAFMPGLTGRMYAQFALVIAATAFLSAVNAATLKPTQCATFLRRPVPPERRNVFSRGFNAAYGRFEALYVRLIGSMVKRSLVMVVFALGVTAASLWSIARIPTGFLPLEDQGYVLVSVQLPDGASLERTKRVLAEVGSIAGKTPGVDQVLTVAGISVLDNSATLANAGVAYVILKDWKARGAGEDLRAIYMSLTAQLASIEEAQSAVIVPPPVQGIGNAGGFTMQVELRDGSNDFAKLQGATRSLIAGAASQSGIARPFTSFRADVPQLNLAIDRVKAETLRIGVGDVFQALATYLGSSFVGQFNQFGRTFQVYAQADAGFRLNMTAVENLPVRNQDGAMITLGTLLQSAPTIGPGLVQLYNLYPAASVNGSPAPGFSSGEALAIMEQAAATQLPPGVGTDWTAMSYQEKTVGNQLYIMFALGILLVYLVLAGQYESWLSPVSVILAVPLSLVGPVVALSAVGADNNLYTQIGIILLVALSAKNAILIVEVAREERVLHGKPILQAAIDAARIRFRPILMTSFAFILGVVPLVLATGAGANARKSIGITVFSGMLASTCLAVLFVPSFFVVLQRLEERRAARRAPATVAE